MKKRQVIIVGSIILIVVASVFIMFGLQTLKKDPPSKKSEKIVLSVKAKSVKYIDIIPEINESGRLGSQHYVDLISEVQGEILKTDITLKKGQNFKKGDLLIKVFKEETKLNLQAAKSRFLNALANILPDMKIDFPGSYNQWMNFFNSINIKKSLPSLPEINSSKEKIFLASRNILNDYYTIKSSEIRLSKYSIYAPFDGSYSNVLLEVGSIANPGSRIAKIIRTDKLELEIPVKAEEVKWLNINDKVNVFTEDKKRKLQGKIIRISDFINQETQAVSVFISIMPDNKIKLMEGQYLIAEFRGESISNVMEIPRRALVNFDEVYVVENGKLLKKEIEIHKINDQTVIFSGLEENAEVVIEALINIQEGDEVKVIR